MYQRSHLVEPLSQGFLCSDPEVEDTENFMGLLEVMKHVSILKVLKSKCDRTSNAGVILGAPQYSICKSGKYNSFSNVPERLNQNYL